MTFKDRNSSKIDFKKLKVVDGMVNIDNYMFIKNRCDVLEKENILLRAELIKLMGEVRTIRVDLSSVGKFVFSPVTCKEMWEKDSPDSPANGGVGTWEQFCAERSENIKSYLQRDKAD